MSDLLTPNLAYLILVAGLLLGVFALLSPGTGVMELGAMFSYVVAGWAIYTLPINAWALIVLLLGVYPFLLALRRSRQQIYLAISVLAMVFGSAYMFRGSTWWQPGVHPVLALVVSLLGGGFFWLITVKILEAEAGERSHDLQNIIGAVGEARTSIHHEGSAQISGELWAVRSEKPIKTGSKVKVVGREGLILDVE